MPDSLFDQTQVKAPQGRPESPRETAQRSVERIEKVLEAVFQKTKQR